MEELNQAAAQICEAKPKYYLHHGEIYREDPETKIMEQVKEESCLSV